MELEDCPSRVAGLLLTLDLKTVSRAQLGPPIARARAAGIERHD